MSSLTAIRHMPESERPRERLLHHGTPSLSTAELIAIVLGNGTKGASALQLAHQLLSFFGGVEHLIDATVPELCQVKGIGRAKAVQIKAALGLGQRAAAHRQQEKVKIDSPWHVFQLLKDQYGSARQEHFIVLMQDTRGCSLGHEVIAIGTLNETLVHPREVFYPAIRHKAASIVVAHNHPSGDPSPSTEDFEVTERLCDAGRLVEIPLIDHIIITSSHFISLRQKGLKCFK